MAYQTYTTPALVCGSYASNTADKSYLLFTKLAGMVYATAKSVREERSRQRYALQDFSQITVSLVKGRSGWRIGSVDSDNNLFVEADSRELRGAVVRFFKHLRRYIHGEGSDSVLYDDVVTGLSMLKLYKDAERDAFECFLMARVLFRLGYVAAPSDYPLLFSAPLKDVPISDCLQAGAVCADMIREAETVSHL